MGNILRPEIDALDSLGMEAKTAPNLLVHGAVFFFRRDHSAAEEDVGELDLSEMRDGEA